MSGETVKIEVSTPADSEIILPDESTRSVQKGEYRFESIYRAH